MRTFKRGQQKKKVIVRREIIIPAQRLTAFRQIVGACHGLQFYQDPVLVKDQPEKVLIFVEVEVAIITVLEGICQSERAEVIAPNAA